MAMEEANHTKLVNLAIGKTSSTVEKKIDQLTKKKVPVFEFEEEKKLPVTETFMVLGSISNWAKETEQKIFKKTRE
ncbi:hypothetical protein G9A89_010540 [Geosiphon pyriformis]|nr:hypothetical protein G9A89_010540 [Geosiphon pyriformis]